MTRLLKSRVPRLETRGRPPVRVRNNVVIYDPQSDAILSPLPPKGRKIMLAPHFGTDAEWGDALLAQQAKLIGDAKAAEQSSRIKE